MTATHEPDLARETYRHLRMALVALALLLLVGTVCAALFFGEVATSISANYAGPLRNVFVGSLVGIGACLVAYRGRPLEDYALNLAGFYAMFVALVPSNLASDLAAIEDVARRQDASNSVRVATITVLVVAGAFLVAEKLTGHWTGDTLAGPAAPVKAKFFYRVSWALGIAFVALLLYRIWEGTDFKYVHPTAAILLVTSMAVAVACNGWPSSAGEDLEGLRRYKIIALLMVPGVFVVLLLARWLVSDYTVAIIEWWSVGLFAAFWTMETVRQWNGPGGRAAGVAGGSGRRGRRDGPPVGANA